MSTRDTMELTLERSGDETLGVKKDYDVQIRSLVVKLVSKR